MALVDVRGSAYRTVDEIFSIKHAIGSAEVIDHLEIISVLTQLPFIDKDRVGVWGWSYGGFLAGTALTRDTKNIVKCE